MNSNKIHSTNTLIFSKNPKQPKPKVTSVRIPGDVGQSLATLVERDSGNQNDVIVRAIRFYLLIEELVDSGAKIFVHNENDIKEVVIKE